VNSRIKGVICSKHVEMSDNTFQHVETYATQLAAHKASNSAQHGADGCRQLQHNGLCKAYYIMITAYSHARQDATLGLLHPA